jgi:hypothetical protein
MSRGVGPTLGRVGLALALLLLAHCSGPGARPVLCNAGGLVYACTDRVTITWGTGWCNVPADGGVSSDAATPCTPGTSCGVSPVDGTAIIQGTCE